MSRVSHGYANTYGTTTVPAAAPGPRHYMEEKLFPAVRERVKTQFRLEMFTHALPTPNGWPPQAWSHDRALWTVYTRQQRDCPLEGSKARSEIAVPAIGIFYGDFNPLRYSSRVRSALAGKKAKPIR
jgi:hypothetical protein